MKAIKKIRFQIELPFWLDLENGYSLEYKTKKKEKIKITVLQNLWGIHGVGTDLKKYVILPERLIIDGQSLEIKKELPGLKNLNINSFDNAMFYPLKKKSVLSIIYEIKSEGKILLELIRGNKSIIINEINRLLRLYSNIKLNSTNPIIHIIPLYQVTDAIAFEQKAFFRKWIRNSKERFQQWKRQDAQRWQMVKIAIIAVFVAVSLLTLIFVLILFKFSIDR